MSSEGEGTVDYLSFYPRNTCKMSYTQIHFNLVKPVRVT